MLPSIVCLWAASCLLLLLRPAAHAHAHAHDAHKHKDYSWNTGSWGVCWSEVGCGLGSEERTVWCGDAHGRPLPPTLCGRRERPPNSRTCYAACSDGSWQVDSWSPCEADAEGDAEGDADGLCVGRRTRNVTCVAGGAPAPGDRCGGPRPQAESPCEAECPPPSSPPSGASPAAEEPLGVRLRVGEWKPCQAPSSSSSSRGENSVWREKRDALGPSDLPVVGRQERELSCVHANGSRLPLSLCLSGRRLVAERVRTCVVSQDCVVTEWSSWSTVVPGCVAPSGLVVREVRERRRTSPGLQQGEGVPCPHLLERHTLPDPSLQPCDTRYQWVSSAWGPCRDGASAVHCGGGVQTRQLTCVRAADHVPVPDELCVHVEPPPRVQRCEVGCERDCVVGPWSAWGVCTPTDCTASPPPATPGFRRRRRQVVVTPSPKGADCPPLEEQSECHESQCHQWVPGRWSTCLLADASRSCGVGRRHRSASCLDSAGAPAPRQECEQELGDAPQQEECHVPCSFDCVVGEWSPWSPCTRPCATQLHVGYTQRNTTIVAPPGAGGMTCPPPDELTQVETCRVEPCGGAAWAAGRWNNCSLPARAACGPGRQTRRLLCKDDRNGTLPPYMCSGLSRPDLERQCEVPCGTACTVTSWSGWSPCLAPDPCPMDGVLVSSVQRRWRRVLVEAKDGGEACPQLREERGCAHAPVACAAHRWRKGPWSPCALAEGVDCGVGFRVRSVECVDASGRAAEPTHCLLGSRMVPESSAECHVSCRSGQEDDGEAACVASSWSAWTPCPTHPPCGRTSSRRRELLGRRRGCRRDLALLESRECPCHSFYSSPAGPWSSCVVGGARREPEAVGAVGVVEEEAEEEAGAGLCGVGRRYRASLCRRDDGVLAHPRWCGHAGIQEEPCMVECPSDCQLGPWGPWSSCNASCGAGLQVRTREVLEPSLWGGRPCPETVQSRACWGPCSSGWVPGGWSECQVTRKQDCGTGVQTRSVRCMREASTGLQEEAPEGECDPFLRPVSRQVCRISCPGECVLSSWSPWSSCPEGCPESGRRSRRRRVVRRPSGGAAAGCPPLTEEEPCARGASCWIYRWKEANWTSCVPLGHSSCGEGVRNRPVTCVRSGGAAVPDRMCPRDTRPSPIETWCYVDCPIDCEVTPWTPWNDSKCSCGERPGEMTRRRFLSVNPSESGRPCPAQLQQSRPCPAVPCYTWERGPWSQCHLQGGTCGHGYVERNVSCVGPGSQTVDPKLCLALVHVGGHTWPYLARALDLNTRDGCYVPCEGDCELTEWAPWSHCHRDCSRGHQGGTQARSRAVLTEGSSERGGGKPSCPGPLWETRPCLAGPCLNFTWKVRDGAVRCVRSDGLLVTGGCEGQPRPCVPECAARGSVCSPSVGACVCRAGLRPLYSERQRFRLTGCVPGRNLTFPLPQPLSGAKYLPEDINVWMFAMVGVGSAFVVFVVISMYLLCQSPREQTTTPMTLRRQKNLRHRPV